MGKILKMKKVLFISVVVSLLENTTFSQVFNSTDSVILKKIEKLEEFEKKNE